MVVQARREIRTITREAASSGARVAKMRAEFKGRIVKLSSNEGPLPPFPAAIEAMRQAAGEVNRYADPDSKALRARLAELHGLPADHLTVGGGSGSVIKQVAFTFLSPGDEVITGWPGYPAAALYASAMGADLIKVPLRDWQTDLTAILDQITPHTKMVLLCNPNNPTGVAIPRDAMDEYLRWVPDHVITMVDEAYCHFADPQTYPQLDRYLARGDAKPITIMRTFSKAYALAGARVGYAILPPALLADFNLTREQYPVNHMGLAAALASLDDPGTLSERVAMLRQGRSYLHQQFDEMGLFHTDSQANFTFVDFGRDSEPVNEGLMKRGVLVKTGHQYDSPTFLRVTVGLPDENEIFINALRATLADL